MLGYSKEFLTDAPYSAPQNQASMTRPRPRPRQHLYLHPYPDPFSLGFYREPISLLLPSAAQNKFLNSIQSQCPPNLCEKNVK